MGSECGAPIRGGRTCGRPAGHVDRAGHYSAEAWARKHARRDDPEWKRGYNQRYREANTERLREYDRSRPNKVERVAKNRERARQQRAANHERAVRWRYGLEFGEYAKIKAYQGGKCAVCQRATGRSKRLSVDHCHKTHTVRGLLCSFCNHALGYLRDDPNAFQRAIDYLNNPPAEKALGRVVVVPENSTARQPPKKKIA